MRLPPNVDRPSFALGCLWSPVGAGRRGAADKIAAWRKCLQSQRLGSLPTRRRSRAIRGRIAESRAGMTTGGRVLARGSWRRGRVTTIGPEMAKSGFPGRGIDDAGPVVMRYQPKRIRGGILIEEPPCLVGIKACASSTIGPNCAKELRSPEPSVYSGPCLLPLETPAANQGGRRYMRPVNT